MIKITEYGKGKVIPKRSISEEDRLFLNKFQYINDSRKRRYHLQENKEGIYIYPLNYVGVIQLNRLKINIVPRFDNDITKLIQMILYCEDINYN